MSRDTGVKNNVHTVFHTELNPALKRRVDLFIGEAHAFIKQNRDFRRAFKDISGYMAVLPHVIA